MTSLTCDRADAFEITAWRAAENLSFVPRSRIRQSCLSSWICVEILEWIWFVMFLEYDTVFSLEESEKPLTYHSDYPGNRENTELFIINVN